MNLPADDKLKLFRARLEAIAKERFAEAWRWLDARQAAHALVLPWRIRDEEALAELRRAGIPAELRDARVVAVAAEHRAQLLSHPLVQEGAVYPMAYSSILAARMLAPDEAAKVLDACAAPGGKLLALIAEAPRAAYTAIERVRARFYKLSSVLARAHAPAQVRLKLGDARRVIPRLSMRFTHILVDAPCSTEARIRPSDPDTLAHWSLRKIREQARKQRGILVAALNALAPGGVLVYVTCSFAPEENEMVVAHALAKVPEVELAPVGLSEDVPAMPALDRWGKHRFPEAVQQAVRILPGPWTEAMFVARFIKRR